MTDMPWRLQLAMAAMQGDWAAQDDVSHGIFSGDLECADAVFQKAANLYLHMADAMLAEHERTVGGSAEQTDANNLSARRLVAKIRTSADAFSMPVFRDMLNDAADELERMLNESK